MRKIHIHQGWLPQHLGYGNVEIFAGDSSKPKVIISGVVKPDVFKERLEMILKRKPHVAA